LLKGIEKYSSGILRQRSSSPKFQVHNSAFITAQQQLLLPEAISQSHYWGRRVESAIGTHLLAWSLQEDFQLYYWRHRNDEVDFVIASHDRAIGIEVKSGASGKTSGMAAFQQKFIPCKIIMVGDQGIPWREFFKLNPMQLFA
jgi:predicted AAA+ superfamily ATPase